MWILVSVVPIISDDNLKVTAARFFVAVFNLSSCKYANFTLEPFCIDIVFNYKLAIVKRNNNTFRVLCKNSKIQNRFFYFFNNEKHCYISCSI